MRILLDPTNDATGADTKVEVREVVKEVEKPIDPDKTVVKKADLDAMKAGLTRLKEFEDAEALKAEEARKAAEDKAREKGEHEKIIKDREKDIAARDQTIAEVRQKAKETESKAALALGESRLLRELPSGIIDGKSSQLVRLMMDGIETVLTDGEFVTKAKNGQTLSEYVKEQMAKEYQHFLVAGSRGGAGAKGGDANATKGNDPNRVKTEGEKLAEHYAASGGSFGFGRQYRSN